MATSAAPSHKFVTGNRRCYSPVNQRGFFIGNPPGCIKKVSCIRAGKVIQNGYWTKPLARKFSGVPQTKGLVKSASFRFTKVISNCVFLGANFLKKVIPPNPFSKTFSPHRFLDKLFSRKVTCCIKSGFACFQKRFFIILLFYNVCFRNSSAPILFYSSLMKVTGTCESCANLSGTWYANLWYVVRESMVRGTRIYVVRESTVRESRL